MTTRERGGGAANAAAAGSGTAGARQPPNCRSASAKASSVAQSPPTISVALSGRKYCA
jgi:hypothetical protein